jgi:hypothetical protein
MPLPQRFHTTKTRTGHRGLGLGRSLIPGLDVKLSTTILAGPLFSPR